MVNVFYGTNGDDGVSFIDGFQFLYGFGGNDVLESGDMTLCELLGGDGNDTLKVSRSGLADGGRGKDTIFGSDGDDELYGGVGNDTISGQNAPMVFGGHDRIDGGSGNDFCDGGTGDDKLFGGAGGDALVGGLGRDVLVGGTGRDGLNGGDDDNAVDIFRFTSVKDSLPGAPNRDVIVFFEEIDLFDLARIDANTNRVGDQKFNFIGNAAFGHHAAELRFANNILSGDVDGDGKADFQVQVIGAVLAGNLIL
jgi:serralysin